MRKLFFVLIFCLNFIALNFDVSFSNNSAGYHFLRTYSGARPSAMGGAFISISGDIHSIYFNPAGLAEINGKMASATYLNHILDFQSGLIAWSQQFKNLGQFAIAVNYMNYGEFDETDVNGKKLGAFNAGSFYMTSSLARKFNKNLMIGASAKFIYSTIHTYSSTAVAVDLGILYHIPFIDDFNVGVGIFNLGTAISPFLEKKDPLPFNLTIGFSKKLAHLPLEYCVSVNKYIDDDFRINVGGEFTLSDGFFLRIGYHSLGMDQKIGGDGDQFSGVSLGLGINWHNYQFDYGLSSYGAIGYLNRLSFSYKF